jgi:hypothetical protein
MKKGILIIAFTFMLQACGFEDKPSTPFTEIKPGTIEEELKNIPDHVLTTITYEGCEYLIYKEEKDQNSAFGFMAHKGNCSNPIHCYEE